MDEKVAFIIHKPVGYLSCTVDPQITTIVMKKNDPLYLQQKGGYSRPTVYRLAEEAGFPINFSLVGRLDVETSGIMLFTSNIPLDMAIRNPPEENAAYNTYKTKEYSLYLLGQRIYHGGDEFLIILEKELAEPFEFSRHGQKYYTAPADVKVIRRWQEPSRTLGQPHLGWCVEVRVRLQEGKHHQIRRMAKRSKCSVLKLVRTRIAGILRLDSVPQPGQCRWLEQDELNDLYKNLLPVEEQESS